MWPTAYRWLVRQLTPAEKGPDELGRSLLGVPKIRRILCVLLTDCAVLQ